MMSHLKIQNFLSLRDVDIEIKPLTVLVGPQATGKSLIAKLVYLFNHIPQIMDETLINESMTLNREIFQAILGNIENFFQSIFPAYSWQKQSFRIEFFGEDMQISLGNSGGQLTVDFSEKYKEQIEFCFSELKRLNKSSVKNVTKNLSEYISRGLVTQRVLHIGHKKDKIIFIPAGRSFFAMIQRNPYYFWQEKDNIAVDYFIREFGAAYAFLHAGFVDDQDSVFSVRIPSDVVKGNYTYDSNEKKAYIQHDNGVKTEMKDASSGEQEYIPIFLILNQKQNSKDGCIIEEPEAHLFPGAQKEMTKMLAEYFNTSKNLFITTHSPYLLTVFNNLVHAGLLEQKFGKDQDKIKKLNRVVAKKYRINPSEFAAYLVDRGVVKDIVNSKSKLINASTIDAVSDKIFSEFDQLLELES